MIKVSSHLFLRHGCDIFLAEEGDFFWCCSVIWCSNVNLTNPVFWNCNVGSVELVQGRLIEFYQSHVCSTEVHGGRGNVG